MVNVQGQHFDVLKAGPHVLIHVPLQARPSGTFLHVEADAQKVGGACADTYFMSINITGRWAESEVRKRVLGGGKGFTFTAGAGKAHTGTKWMSFGKVTLKVVHGRTREGTAYLNFFARNLRKAGYLVGGLLGEDDHTEAASPSRECRKTKEI